MIAMDPYNQQNSSGQARIIECLIFVFLFTCITAANSAQSGNKRTEDKVVKTGEGAIFLLQSNTFYRIKDKESRKAYAPELDEVETIAAPELAKYTDGGEAPLRRVISEKVYVDTGKESKSVTIPEGWNYVSHELTWWKNNGGSKKVALKKEDDRVSRVLVTVKGGGDTRPWIIFFYAGKKTKKNQKQQGAKVTIVIEENSSRLDRQLNLDELDSLKPF